MRLHPIASVAVATIVLVACGADEGDGNAEAGPASESAYCQTARRWAVHELTPIDHDDAGQLRTYMKDYVDFIDQASAQAPTEIAAQWQASRTGFKTTALPVLEKYGFSVERILSEGTDAEKAVSEPPPDIADAQAAIHRYEGRVCDTSQPEAADVTFAGPADRAYCEASAALDGLISEAMADPDPKALESVLTGKELPNMMSAVENAAPDEIRQNAVAINTWDREKKIPLTASYGYDIRKLLLEGTAQERKILQDRLPKISDHYARVAAYKEQLCQAAGDDADQG